MRILLAVDGSKFSEAAVEAVLAQCVRRGTEVAVLYVAEELAAFGYPAGVCEKQKRLAPALVRRVAEKLRAAGFLVTTLVSEGEPAEEIVDAAADWDADLIVLGSHGRKGLERFLLGSVSETVARHAPCSVEIVRAPSRRHNSKSGGDTGVKARGKPRKHSGNF
ncbi:MAG TPA: universal stress protein [Candidatus Acidoferrales bacterium]|nr:universal stress protein [Candidatus Acidoferrales bacterium]